MRLCIVQPSLAHYRVPVFRELAGRPNVDLTVWYAQGVPGQNVSPDGFHAELRPMRTGRLLGEPWYWHAAQLDAAISSFDAAIFTWDIHYLSLLPALRRGRRRGVGTVLWGHGAGSRDAGLLGRPKRWLARQADALLLYNEPTAQTYRDRGHTHVFAAPNTIDVAPIDRATWRDPEKIAAFRREQNLHSPTLLHVSRLVPERRLDILIEAVATLPDVTLVIVGTGSAEAALRAQAAPLGDRVRFVGPLFEPEELAPWYAIASAVVMPSFGGLGILSALAFGVPVVIGNDLAAHGPEAATVENGVNGRVFDAAAPAALPRVLAELLADDRHQANLAAAAHRTVREHFGLRAMVDGIVAAATTAATAAGR